MGPTIGPQRIMVHMGEFQRKLFVYKPIIMIRFGLKRLSYNLFYNSSSMDWTIQRRLLLKPGPRPGPPTLDPDPEEPMDPEKHRKQLDMEKWLEDHIL